MPNKATSTTIKKRTTKVPPKKTTKKVASKKPITKTTPKRTTKITPPKKRVTKSDLVEQHLISKGKITSWEAIDKYAATRLAAIIFNLRESGYKIVTNRKEHTDKYGNAGSYAEYVLVKAPKRKKKK